MLALGIASLLLTQSQAKPIPDIDWNNLPYQQQVKQMADGWRQKYHLPGVGVAPSYLWGYSKNTQEIIPDANNEQVRAAVCVGELAPPR